MSHKKFEKQLPNYGHPTRNSKNKCQHCIHPPSIGYNTKFHLNLMSSIVDVKRSLTTQINQEIKKKMSPLYSPYFKYLVYKISS